MGPDGIGQLTPRQRAELTQLLEAEGLTHEAVRRVERDPRTRFKTLASDAQKRLWFLCKYHNNPSLYNEVVSFDLVGPLNAALLERALNAGSGAS